jgi:hypothetical protein
VLVTRAPRQPRRSIGRFALRMNAESS